MNDKRNWNGILGSTTLLDVKCLEQTVAGSLRVGSKDIVTVHCESWTTQSICQCPVPSLISLFKLMWSQFAGG